MENLMEKITEASAFLHQQGINQPETGIVLGTGLGTLAGNIEDAKIIPYAEIPHFPAATVEFHKGQLISGNIGNKKVLVMQGRFHFYEGYSMQQITF
ncbi:MAG: purine-nucleoside phosphorylase, partial [Bacteroidota bacterium]|nr:purine-nucleoside phosphorylase [Bacteroidota bacterium]